MSDDLRKLAERVTATEPLSVEGYAARRQWFAAFPPDVVLGLLDRAEQAEARERAAYQRGYREGHREGLSDDGGVGAARERTLRAALDKIADRAKMRRSEVPTTDYAALVHIENLARQALAAAPAPEEGS